MGRAAVAAMVLTVSLAGCAAGPPPIEDAAVAAAQRLVPAYNLGRGLDAEVHPTGQFLLSLEDYTIPCHAEGPASWDCVGGPDPAPAYARDRFTATWSLRIQGLDGVQAEGAGEMLEFPLEHASVHEATVRLWDQDRGVAILERTAFVPAYWQGTADVDVAPGAARTFLLDVPATLAGQALAVDASWEPAAGTGGGTLILVLPDGSEDVIEDGAHRTLGPTGTYRLAWDADAVVQAPGTVHVLAALRFGSVPEPAGSA